MSDSGETGAPSPQAEDLSWPEDSWEGEEHKGWSKSLEQLQVGALRFPVWEASGRLLRVMGKVPRASQAGWMSGLTLWSTGVQALGTERRHKAEA